MRGGRRKITTVSGPSGHSLNFSLRNSENVGTSTEIGLRMMLSIAMLCI